MGTEVAQWLRCCATNRKVAGSIPAGVSGFFIDIKSFRSHHCSGVDSASNRNEYQKYVFPDGKGGRCVRLTTYHHPCAVVTKSGSLNFLEPSGPVTGLLYLYTVVCVKKNVRVRGSFLRSHKGSAIKKVLEPMLCGFCVILISVRQIRLHVGSGPLSPDAPRP